MNDERFQIPAPDARTLAGRLLLAHGHFMGDKIDAGIVQGYMVEFAAEMTRQRDAYKTIAEDLQNCSLPPVFLIDKDTPGLEGALVLNTHQIFTPEELRRSLAIHRLSKTTPLEHINEEMIREELAGRKEGVQK